jgi:galactokinase
LDATDALAQNDLTTLGALMAQSHASMRDDFEITVPAIDELVALLQRAIGPVGGARMTGGGFGGACVAVMPAARVDKVRAAISAAYKTPDGASPLIMVEPPAPGVAIV